MEGSGSGTWYRWNVKRRVEDYRSLDVGRMQEAGLLRSGSISGWEWRSPNGARAARIDTRFEGGVLILAYKFRRNGQSWEDVEERVSVAWTVCNFGGERPWFICPGTRCSRRVAKLYAGGYFICRHCLGLAYESQREAPEYRLMRRERKIRMRLGGSSDLAASYPDKPKGMHWTTYTRLYENAVEAECASLLKATEKFGSKT